jgi:hypothetical protein
MGIKMVMGTESRAEQTTMAQAGERTNTRQEALLQI